MRGVAELQHWHRHGHGWRHVPAHARGYTCVLKAIEVALCSPQAGKRGTEHAVTRNSQLTMMGRRIRLLDSRVTNHYDLESPGIE